jgi:hypothetical protein
VKQFIVKTVAIAGAFLGIAGTGTVRAQVGAHDATPIPTANPSVRHNAVILTASKLAIERTTDSLSVAVDRTGLKPAAIQVGENMITGLKYEWFVYPKDQPRPGSRSSGLAGTDFNIGTSLLNTKTDGIPRPGQSYFVELDWSVFETDIPQQHMWSPETSGKYNVLLQGKLRQLVGPKLESERAKSPKDVRLLIIVGALAMFAVILSRVLRKRFRQRSR